MLRELREYIAQWRRRRYDLPPRGGVGALMSTQENPEKERRLYLKKIN
jgi:hypothetical protein